MLGKEVQKNIPKWWSDGDLPWFKLISPRTNPSWCYPSWQPWNLHVISTGNPRPFGSFVQDVDGPTPCLFNGPRMSRSHSEWVKAGRKVQRINDQMNLWIMIVMHLVLVINTKINKVIKWFICETIHEFNRKKTCIWRNLNPKHCIQLPKYFISKSSFDFRYCLFWKKCWGEGWTILGPTGRNKKIYEHVGIYFHKRILGHLYGERNWFVTSIMTGQLNPSLMYHPQK